MSGDDQGDLLSGIDDVSLMRFLLEDLHDDLLGKVQRFRYLHDLGEQNGRRTMLFGGHLLSSDSRLAISDWLTQLQ